MIHEEDKHGLPQRGNVIYRVRCTVSSPGLAVEFLLWLETEHLEDVLRAGAMSATLVRLDAPELVFEARYVFADMAAFLRYEREEAPRLRAEGLARFPVELGLTYERTIDEVLLAKRGARSK